LLLRLTRRPRVLTRPSFLEIVLLEYAMAVDRLAVDVCRAIRAVRGAHEAWIDLDRLVGRPGLESRTAVDAAVAFAAAKGWLAIARNATGSVLLSHRAP